MDVSLLAAIAMATAGLGSFLLSNIYGWTGGKHIAAMALFAVGVTGAAALAMPF